MDWKAGKGHNRYNGWQPHHEDVLKTLRRKNAFQHEDLAKELDLYKTPALDL